MKLNRNYNVGFAELVVHGLPDFSLGHDANTIGIIINWELKLIGHSILEGKKEHIDKLIAVVNAYSSQYISGMTTSITSECKLVALAKREKSHVLSLTSSKKNIEPLSITMDDAELSDLTLCVDKFVYDKNICVTWNERIFKDIIRRRINKSSYKSQLTHLLIGILFLFMSSIFYLRLPNPKLEFPSQSIETDLSRL